MSGWRPGRWPAGKVRSNRAVSPAQRDAQRAFTAERRRIRDADRRLHTAPPAAAAELVGFWSCWRCKRYEFPGEPGYTPPAIARDPAGGLHRVHAGACPPVSAGGAAGG